VIDALTRKISELGADSCYVRQVSLSDEEIEVLIRRSRRKTMALHVSPDELVELRVPMKCPWAEINAFLESKLNWVAKVRNELANMPRREKTRFQDGSVHRYLGSDFPLRLVAGRPNLVMQTQGAIVLRCSKPEREPLVERHLNNWYRTQAERFFPLRVESCLQKFDESIPFKKMNCRRMKAQWGSCSRNGEICLNSMLMQMPTATIDFVITHELCHLRHFSHSKSFYQLLSSVMPDWKEREKLLLS
jgi:hypothetical protein